MFEAFIFGNSVLHERLNLSIHILSTILSYPYRELPEDRLMQLVGGRKVLVIEICRSLHAAGFLSVERAEAKTAWSLACDPYRTTIEDLVNGLGDIYGPESDTKRTRRGGVTHAPTDAFLMQATLNVNRLAMNYLRQFTLDRLALPTRWHRMDSSPHRHNGRLGSWS